MDFDLSLRQLFLLTDYFLSGRPYCGLGLILQVYVYKHKERGRLLSLYIVLFKPIRDHGCLANHTHFPLNVLENQETLKS